MNERGVPGDASWRKPKRQISERGSGGGDAPDQPSQEFRTKDVGEGDSPQRGRLRGLDISDSLETRRSILEQRHPDWPKIHMTAYFAAHATRDDMRQLPELMKDADIYFYEDAGGNGVTQGLQHTANGKFWDGNPSTFSTEELIQATDFSGHAFPGVFETQFRALYRSGVVVGHIDLRPEDGITLTNFNYGAGDQERSLEGYVSNYYQNRKTFAEVQQKREKIIIEAHLEEELTDIFRRNPELKAKDSVKILMSMGDLHEATLEPALKEQVAEISSVVEEVPCGYDNQVVQGLIQGVEPTPESLIRGHIENLFKGVLHQVMEEPVKNSYIISKFLSYVVSDLSLEDMRTFHNNYVWHYSETVKIVSQSLPKTNEDLERIVRELQLKEKEAAEPGSADNHQTYTQD